LDETRSDSEDRARITLTPDMRPLGRDPQPGAARPEDQGAADPVARAPTGRWPLALAAAGLALGLGALTLSSWTYLDGQREILRLSTELAQLKVSLDLYARSGAGGADLTGLGDRLSALEQSAATGATPAISAVPPPATATTTPRDDCLPVGMRLLVASGDSYPICDQQAEVSISFVDNGYITLGDGTSVASGGTTPLPGNPACTIAVTSGGDEGLTGYAEIRVNC
jgi:hypothetical protein